MAIGPGKYDTQLAVALESISPAGAATGCLIIFDGRLGPGFSVKATAGQLAAIPTILRKLANDIEKDFREGIAN